MKHLGLRIAAAGVMVGGGLIFLPIHTNLRLADWADELRRTGVPTQGYVFDRTPGGGDMLLRYQADGVTHEEQVGCAEVCLEPGATPRIWYSPADPLDFVTDFGELSGVRGQPEGFLGVLGVILVGLSLWLAFATAGQEIRFRHLSVLVDPDSEVTGGRATRHARSTAAATALLETLRGKHIDELRLATDLDGETAWPLIEWLQEQAYAGTRPDIGRIVIHGESIAARDMARALREWAYEVSV